MKELNYNEEEITLVRNAISQEGINLTNCKLDGRDRLLTQMITQWTEEKPLLKLCLISCSMSQTTWNDILQCLSSCKHVIHLNLSGNFLGKAGHQLAQSIRSWGDNPPLKVLYLGGCSIPERVWTELLESLSSCKQLVDLDLSYNSIGKAGRYLAQSITSWGDNPPLQKVDLRCCLIPQQVCAELLQSLSSCKQLTGLYLTLNIIGEAGRYLAQSITSWGGNPPLQKLKLVRCSIPQQVWLELLQSLSSCKQLTDLDLRGNTIGEAGCYLAQSITSWVDDPPLKELSLYNCSLTATASLELVLSLSTCRHLTELQLGENKLGEAGHQLAQSIRSWGDEPPLQKLRLSNCSLPATASLELVQSLILCKHLEILDLRYNDSDETGYDLAQSLRSSVQYVYLPHGPTVTAAQCYPPVALLGEVILHDYDTSSDESNGHCCSDNSNSELGVYSETEQDEQFENEGIATAGNAIQKIVQRPYREEMTEFGIKIRRYEDERPESLVLTSLDSIVPGAVGGNNDTDKYSLQKLPTLQVTNI